MVAAENVAVFRRRPRLSVVVGSALGGVAGSPWLGQARLRRAGCVSGRGRGRRGLVGEGPHGRLRERGGPPPLYQCGRRR